MKRIALIVLAVLGAASVSAAAGQISFGFKAGVNSANMVTADADVDWSARRLPVGGAFIRFFLSDSLYLQPEVLYSPKGTQITQTNGTTTVTTTVFAPYIDVPILLRFQLPVGSEGGLRPYLFAGPYFGIKAGSGTMTTEAVSGGQTDTSEASLTSLKTLDFGLALGAGIEFPVAALKASFDVRWATSLSTISKEEEITKNKVWTFLIGIAFD